jgi:hypothetical protein
MPLEPFHEIVTTDVVELKVAPGSGLKLVGSPRAIALFIDKKNTIAEIKAHHVDARK